MLEHAPDGSERGAAPRDAVEVARLISEFIAGESLQPGDRVGAERELADRYGVSRWVIRKALQQLEGEDLVLRTHGRSGGVFVAPEKVVRDLNPMRGLPQFSVPKYVRAQGHEAGTTVLGTRAGPADEQVAKELRISPDDWVFQIDRLRLADGLPFCVESAFFPAELFPGLLDQSLVGSLTEVLESQYGMERGATVEVMAAVPADREHAATLQVSVGAPLLMVTRTGELASGQVFEFNKERYRADRTAIVVHASGTAGATRQLV